MKRTIFLLALSTLSADFNVIVLGSGGGPLETNLSCYLVAKGNTEKYAAIDAGSLLGGLYAARLDPLSTLQEKIKAYLITHAHLDHVAGLVINSPVDTKKPIMGLPSTIDNIRDHLFNWKIWPNFGSEGKKPLYQYKYQRLARGLKTPIPGTDIDVQAYPLSHPDGYTSTAFLFHAEGDYFLFFGDTSSDLLEKKKHIQGIWKLVLPLIKQKKLRHIFLECSYTDKEDTADLFGHLTPTLWIKEFRRLALLMNPNDPINALQGLHTYVTHIKEPPPALKTIRSELERLNNLGLILHFPQQGDKLELK